MPPSDLLSFSDLSLGQTVCEIRYEMAFLIFDRTGAICQDNKERYPELKILQASPSTTSFSAGEYTLAVEQMASRISCSKARHDQEQLGKAAFSFFEIVLRQLEIRVLNRIGLRQLFFKTFKGREEAATVIENLKLEYGSSDHHFGIDKPSKEIVLRWETAEHGAMFHLTSIPGSSIVTVADVFKIEEGHGKTYESAVLVDVDFYTIAPVVRSQWNAEEWLAQSSHVVKKGIRNFLLQCQ